MECARHGPWPDRWALCRSDDGCLVGGQWGRWPAGSVGRVDVLGSPPHIPLAHQAPRCHWCPSGVSGVLPNLKVLGGMLFSPCLLAPNSQALSATIDSPIRPIQVAGSWMASSLLPPCSQLIRPRSPSGPFKRLTTNLQRLGCKLPVDLLLMCPSLPSGHQVAAQPAEPGPCGPMAPCHSCAPPSLRSSSDCPT